MEDELIDEQIEINTNKIGKIMNEMENELILGKDEILLHEFGIKES